MLGVSLVERKEEITLNSVHPVLNGFSKRLACFS